MSYVDKINVQGTDYDINDKRLPESDGTVVLNKNFQANDISGSEIIERMSGYSAELDTPSNYTLEAVYIGAVKNGNKITFAVAVNITKTSDEAINNPTIAFINIPSTIGAKLYPSQVGDTTFLDNKVISAWSNFVSKVDCPSYVDKDTNSKLRFVLAGGNNLVVNTKYYFRYEVTFLLSDNLAA